MDNALDFLCEQAQDAEDKAKQALAQAHRELDNYYQQLKQIEAYRLDYCAKLVEQGQRGLTASQYGHLNRFLTTLDETLAKQKQAETHFLSQVEGCQQNWLACRTKRKSFEWLIEKKQKQQRHQENVREQKQMDEFSILRYSRRAVM